MDQLAAISLFIKAVETGSFSEAGRRSGHAPSSVSRRIAGLERQVGAALFHRTTRKLTLTDAGASYYQRVRNVVLDLEEARVVAAGEEDRPSGSVRLTAPASLQRHVTAAVCAFSERWPSVRFAVEFTDRVVDLVGEGFDLAVRIGALEDSTLKSRRLAEVSRRLCASPRYLERAGIPVHPRDLLDHSCLVFRTHPGYNLWRFRAGRKVVEVRASGELCSNSGDALLCAAREGAGVVLEPDFLTAPLLASGELVEVLPDFRPQPARTPIYAVHAYQRFVPPRVGVLITFLAKRFGGDYDWGSAAPL